MSIIRLEAVTRHIALADAPPLHVLNGIDLVVEPGDRVSIVGRSGSGKSTLLNILGMVDHPTTGQQYFDEQPVIIMSPKRRDRLRGANVGFVFQQFNLIEGMTATENVVMPLMYAGTADFWRRERLAKSMLERVGLGHRLHAPVTTLSGGEQQRVAIARALVRAPRLILADEPTGALDLDTGASIMALLDEVATESGAALVTITHDPAVAALSNRKFHLVQGHLSPAEAVAS